MRDPVVAISTGLPRPQWRGRIHTWAFYAAVPATIWLLLTADTDRDPNARVGALVFGLSLIALYGVSAAYHRLARRALAQRLMQRLDHSMIFVLIAGTYTPVCLAALPSPWSRLLLVSIWVLALVGILTKAWGTPWLLSVSNAMYPVLGWLAVLALPLFIRTVAGPPLALMGVGGLLYSIGALVFLFRFPDPIPHVFGYHEVWHSFTVLAGTSHFAMVALIVT
ncbi:MAG: hemolysin III family protein [Actinomycetota bacterium]